MQKYQFLIPVDFGHFILHTFQKSDIFSGKIWTTVRCDACLSHFSPSVSMHSFTSVNRSLPVVVPFIDRIAASLLRNLEVRCYPVDEYE